MAAVAAEVASAATEVAVEASVVVAASAATEVVVEASVAVAPAVAASRTAAVEASEAVVADPASA